MNLDNVNEKLLAEFAKLILQQELIQMKVSDLKNQIVTQARSSIGAESSNVMQEINSLSKQAENIEGGGQKCQDIHGLKKKNIRQH